jgi:hypothetical protein
MESTQRERWSIPRQQQTINKLYLAKEEENSVKIMQL